MEYKKLLAGLVVKQLALHLTFLAGPLGWLLRPIVQFIISEAIEKTVLGVQLLGIDIQTNAQLRKYNKVLERAKKQDEMSIYEKQKLKEDFIIAARDLIKLRNEDS